MSPTRIVSLRRRLGENTSTFGARFARSGRTVEDWEQGRRRPDKLVRQMMVNLHNRLIVDAEIERRRRKRPIVLLELDMKKRRR